LRESLVSLGEAKPGEVVGADLERVGEGEAMVNGDKALLVFRDQDVARVTVQVANAHVKNRNFMHFVRAETVGRIVLNGTRALNELLKAAGL
jgi:hypothetical protein